MSILKIVTEYREQNQAQKNLIAIREEIRELRRRGVTHTQIAYTLNEVFHWDPDSAYNAAELILNKPFAQGIRYQVELNKAIRRNMQPLSLSPLLVKFADKRSNWAYAGKYINE